MIKTCYLHGTWQADIEGQACARKHIEHLVGPWPRRVGRKSIARTTEFTRSAMIQKTAMTRKLERLIRKVHSTMDVIMVGAWMLSYQNAVDHPPQWMLSRQNASGHGHYHGWALDVLCSECMRHGRYHARPPNRPNPPHGCSLVACQNASDHGCCHGWAMDALGSELFCTVQERIGPCRYHGGAMDAFFSPPQHCFQAPAPVSSF